MTYLLFKGQEIRLMGKVLTFLTKCEVVFVPNITKPGWQRFCHNVSQHKLLCIRTLKHNDNFLMVSFKMPITMVSKCN